MQLKQNIAYGLAVVPAALMMAPLGIIPGVYAKHYGISLTTLAVIILISRLVDAVTDPLVGFCSDRFKARYHTRKPFVVAGIGLSVFCGYFLYVPPDDVTAFYIGFWMVAFYVAYTFFEISHLTWPSDIAKTSEEKTAIYSYRVLAFYAGLILFYSIPMLPFFESNEISPETLRATFFLAAGMAIPCVLLTIFCVPSTTSDAVAQPSSSTLVVSSIRALGSEIKTNKPFFIFIGAFFCYGLANGMWYGLIFIYVDAYLGMGEQFAKIFLMAFITGILVTPLWYRLALKIGKKNVWSIAVMLLIFSFVFSAYLNPENASFSKLIVLKVVQTCGFICIGAVTPAMLSEIIDYSHWKSGTENNATYFSIKVFLEKTNIAVGGAFGLALAGWFGFNAANELHLAESVMGLKIGTGWLPTILALASLVFVRLSPIDERRHQIIRQQLDKRAAKLAAASAIDGAVHLRD